MKHFLLWILFVAGGLLPSATASIKAQTTPEVRELTFGESAEGRPITGTKIGNGSRKLFIVANTHGGPEANTYELALALQAYFRQHPAEVPEAVSLYIIPTVNPDGLALGSRFNSRSVDLNRNMDTDFDACPENDWRQTVEGAYGYISDTGGAFVESEVESQLVRDLVLDASAVIWLHSSGGNVFPAFCEHAPSIALAQAYAEAGDYRYDRYWANYNITGGMNDWAGALDIASITPELLTGELPEIEQNLAAVQYVLQNYTTLLPLKTVTTEKNTQIQMPMLLWRYWRAHGGEDWFGLPISPVVTIDDKPTIFFEQQHLILTADQADELKPVQRFEGGRELWNQYLLNQQTTPFQVR